MTTKLTEQKTRLQTAIDDAKSYSMAGIPTAVFQVGADSFVTTCTPLSCGVLCAVYLNGVQDGRYASLFKH